MLKLKLLTTLSIYLPFEKPRLTIGGIFHSETIIGKNICLKCSTDLQTVLQKEPREIEF